MSHDYMRNIKTINIIEVLVTVIRHQTYLNLSIIARIIRSRRLAFAAAGHCTPAISKSGGGKSGSRRRPSRLLLRNDDERIESGSLSVSDGEAVKSLSPRAPELISKALLGVPTGVFCCGGVAAETHVKII